MDGEEEEQEEEEAEEQEEDGEEEEVDIDGDSSSHKTRAPAPAPRPPTAPAHNKVPGTPVGKAAGAAGGPGTAGHPLSLPRQHTPGHVPVLAKDISPAEWQTVRRVLHVCTAAVGQPLCFPLYKACLT